MTKEKIRIIFLEIENGTPDYIIASRYQITHNKIKTYKKTTLKKVVAEKFRNCAVCGIEFHIYNGSQIYCNKHSCANRKIIRTKDLMAIAKAERLDAIRRKIDNYFKKQKDST